MDLYPNISLSKWTLIMESTSEGTKKHIMGKALVETKGRVQEAKLIMIYFTWERSTGMNAFRSSTVKSPKQHSFSSTS